MTKQVVGVQASGDKLWLAGLTVWKGEGGKPGWSGSRLREITFVGRESNGDVFQAAYGDALDFSQTVWTPQMAVLVETEDARARMAQMGALLALWPERRLAWNLEGILATVGGDWRKAYEGLGVKDEDQVEGMGQALAAAQWWARTTSPDNL